MANELTQAHQLLDERSPVLLILCHTVTAEEAESILDHAENLVNVPKNIILTANGKGCSVANRGEAVDVYDGPEALLIAVKEVLSLKSHVARQAEAVA